LLDRILLLLLELLDLRLFEELVPANLARKLERLLPQERRLPPKRQLPRERRLPPKRQLPQVLDLLGLL